MPLWSPCLHLHLGFLHLREINFSLGFFFTVSWNLVLTDSREKALLTQGQGPADPGASAGGNAALPFLGDIWERWSEDKEGNGQLRWGTRRSHDPSIFRKCSFNSFLMLQVDFFFFFGGNPVKEQSSIWVHAGSHRLCTRAKTWKQWGPRETTGEHVLGPEAWGFEPKGS